MPRRHAPRNDGHLVLKWKEYIQDLLKTLEYVKRSYSVTQVRAKGDDAHIDFTSEFVMRDDTPHDERMYEFIHSPSGKGEKKFSGFYVNPEDPHAEDIRRFCEISSQMFTEFYDNGKNAVATGSEDYDIRYRINALISAMSISQFHKKHAPEAQSDAAKEDQADTPKPSKKAPVLSGFKRKGFVTEDKYASATSPKPTKKKTVIYHVKSVKQKIKQRIREPAGKPAKKR